MRTDKDIEEFKNALSVNLRILKDYLPVIIPKDENDRKIMNLGADLIDCLIKDLHSSTIPLDEIVNVTKVKTDWSKLEKSLLDANSREIYDTIYDISDAYSCMEGDE